jgi:hypothetical protein
MRYRAATLIVFAVLTLFWLASPRPPSTNSVTGGEPQRRSRQSPRRPASASARAPRVNYTNFSHATAQHQKSCDSCHKFPSANWKDVRKVDAAFPDVTEYPEHSSCLECHRPQFFARERPQPKICSVCHVGVTPRNTVRHPFPSLGEPFDASAKGRTSVSDFAVNFPHDKHEGLFSGLRPDSESGLRFLRASFARPRALSQDDPAKADAACATCHQTYRPQNDSDDEYATKPPEKLPEGSFWLKKGTFKTTPRDHATCFTCHSTDGGIEPAPSNCAACHKLLAPDLRARLASAHDDYDPKLAAAMGVADRASLLKWSRREAARFRHEWPPHDLSCVSCHKVASLNTADEATKRVPVLSCGGGGTGCHIEPTPDGTLNFEIAQKLANPRFECTKCHVVNGRLPTPESHAAALPPPAK